jgi:hypothetical protein
MLLDWIKKLLTIVPDSVKDKVNWKELGLVALGALIVYGSGGGVIELKDIMDHVIKIDLSNDEVTRGFYALVSYILMHNFVKRNGVVDPEKVTR